MWIITSIARLSVDLVLTVVALACRRWRCSCNRMCQVGLVSISISPLGAVFDAPYGRFVVVGQASSLGGGGAGQVTVIT